MEGQDLIRFFPGFFQINIDSDAAMHPQTSGLSPKRSCSKSLAASNPQIYGGEEWVLYNPAILIQNQDQKDVYKAHAAPFQKVHNHASSTAC